MRNYLFHKQQDQKIIAAALCLYENRAIFSHLLAIKM